MEKILKENVSKLKCFKPIKRKRFRHFKISEGYEVVGANLLLLKIKRYREVFYRRIVPYYEWSFVKIRTDRFGSILKYNQVKPDMIFDKNLPKEILFNLDVFENILKMVSKQPKKIG